MRTATLTTAVLLTGLLLLALAPVDVVRAQDSNPSAPVGTTLKWEAPEPGAVQSEQSASELSYTLVVKDENGQERHRAELARITAQKKSVMTLAVADRAQTKVLVTYQEWKNMRTIAGRPPIIEEGPGVGKSFVVENRTGEDEDFDLRTPAGDGVVRREAMQILSDNRGVGSMPVLARLFDGKTVRKGDTVRPTPELAEEMFGASYVSASYTFDGTRTERGMNCVVLKADIRTRAEMGNGSILDIQRTGEILLMADTLWPVQVEVKGPVTVSGTANHPQLGKMNFGGSGTSTVSNRFNYSADIVPDEPGINMEPGTAKAPSLHDLSAKLADGTEKKLADYKGKVVLVVNVASKGQFAAHLDSLQALHEKYGDKLVVLGFPCNDFNESAPGTAEDFQKFAAEKGITFPLFEKVTMAPGATQSAVFAFLERASGTLPQWNFFKYLVDQNGDVIAVWDPRTAPDSPEVMQGIEDVIAGKHLETEDDAADGDGE